VLTARVQTPTVRYSSPQQRAGFYSDVLARIRALPGVEDAAAVTALPMSGRGFMRTSYWRSDRPEPAPGESSSADIRPITPDFFTTMGIRMVAGRDFTSADRIDSPRVAIVSERAAQRIFPGEDPIGQRIDAFVGPPGPPFEIVGVVKDIKTASLDVDVYPTVYIPHTQLSAGIMTFVVRTSVPPTSLATGLAAVVHELDPELPLADVRTMTDVVGRTMAQPRVIMTLLTAFAVMALLLAGVGVYGVMAYSVGQRTQEIGVRLAMGATNGMVFRMVIGQAFTLAAIGVGVGLIAAAGAASVLQTFLYNTEPRDPSTFALAAVVLMAVAMLASYVPARRSTRIALAEALHPEA
jgi:putative ABC transport system permease protein